EHLDDPEGDDEARRNRDERRPVLRDDRAEAPREDPERHERREEPEVEDSRAREETPRRRERVREERGQEHDRARAQQGEETSDEGPREPDRHAPAAARAWSRTSVNVSIGWAPAKAV